MRTLLVVVLLGALLFDLVEASEPDCGRSGALEFVCGAEERGRSRAGARHALDHRERHDGGRKPHADRLAQRRVQRPCTRKRSTTQRSPTARRRRTPPRPITHGLNLRAGANGHSTLYAVGHGAREAIEVFDVDATGAKPALTWKGCVPMPEGLAANSVASFADGSLVATVLLMPGKTFADSVAKKPTGAVYEWAPGKKGFEQIRGSELPGNNGIEVSADGKEIFVVSSGFQTIVAFSHANPTKQLRTTRPLPFTPDNVHMGEDGRLLTAGMKNDVPECGGAPGPQHSLEKLSTCPRGFMALAIDPKTMKDTLVAESPRSRRSATRRWCSRSTSSSGSARSPAIALDTKRFAEARGLFRERVRCQR